MSWKWFISSIATLLTLIISIINISHQYLNLCKPKLQLYICRILTMIPVYGILSYISYMFVEYATFLNIIRDCYEAYVMFSFLKLLIFFIGGDEEIIKLLETSKKTRPEIWPHYHLNKSLIIIGLIENNENIIKYNDNKNCQLCDIYKDYYYEKEIDNIYIENLNKCNCIDYHLKISRFYSFIKLGVIQFVIIKPITALFSLFLEYLGLYGVGLFSLRNGFPYISLLNSISVTISIYSLFLLYISLNDQLEPIKPVIKFFCIKLIIFVSFWQSIILSILSYIGIFPKQELYTIKLHNWLLTIEMTICSIIYGIAFSIKNDFKNHIYYNDEIIINNDNNYKYNINNKDDNINDQFNNIDWNNNNNINNQEINDININNNIYINQINNNKLNNSYINKNQLNILIIPKNILFLLFKIIYILNPQDIIQDTKNLFKNLKYNHYKYNCINRNKFDINLC